MASNRREFVKLAATAAAMTDSSSLAQSANRTASEANGGRPDLKFQSVMLSVEMSANQPGFVSFSVDSLGTKKLNENMMLPLAESSQLYKVSREDQTITYRLREAKDVPLWTFEFSELGFVIRSKYSPKLSLKPLVLNFSIDSHATLLGLLSEFGTVRLPALLHFPHHGTFHITTTAQRITLGYDATHAEEGFVRVSFPPANADQTEIEYRCEITAIYPEAGRAGIESDPRYNAYRRDFLSMLQLNPRSRVLANNIASDACAFTVFEYSMMAVKMPALAEGLSALDILRQTLDRYVGGIRPAGMEGSADYPDTKYDLLDTYRSLVLA